MARVDSIKDNVRTTAVAITMLVEEDLNDYEWNDVVRELVIAHVKEALLAGISGTLRELAVFCSDMSRELARDA